MMIGHRGRAGMLAGVVVMLLATGCGTTVRLARATLPAASGVRGAASTATAPNTAEPTSATSSAPAWDGMGAPIDGPAGSLGARVAPTATIRIGFVISSGNTYNDPVTGTQAVTENFDQIVPALVRDLNRHGGIAGHPVEELRARIPQETSNTKQATDEQNACTHLTEDEHVFAVVALFPVRLSTECYANHHTPVLVRTFLGSLDDRSLSRWAPWVIGDDSPDLNTIARLTVATMLREHAMTSPIGIAAPSDDPRDEDVVAHVLVPALVAAGGRVAPSDVIYAPDDLEHAPADSANAVLRWKTDGVRTVIPFDLGPAWGLLGAAAQSQDYSPRWVLDSSGRPQWVLDGQEEVKPPDGERNAIALGVAPGYDVLDSDYPLRPTERHCLAVVNQALGTGLSHRTYGQGAGPLVACRSLALLQQALAPYRGQPLVAEHLAAQVSALGRRYVPLDLPTSWFAPGKPDGSAVWRTSHYVAACQCMRYDSPWTAVPSGR